MEKSRNVSEDEASPRRRIPSLYGALNNIPPSPHRGMSPPKLAKYIIRKNSQSLSSSMSKPIPVEKGKQSDDDSFHTPNFSYATPHSFSGKIQSNLSAMLNHELSTSPEDQKELVKQVMDGHLVEQESSSIGKTVHQLQGGAVTRDIYKWHEQYETTQLARTNSEPDLRRLNQDPMSLSISDLRAGDLRQPGAFRRFFLKFEAKASGRSPPSFLTSNFIDFLVLYGYYGGDVSPDYETNDTLDVEQPLTEETPLLNGRPSTGYVRRVRAQGTSAKKAFFMVLKAFVGTGVLFLPSAFSNGGLLFSVILLVILGYLTLHCMILLVETSRKMNGMSFGELGEAFYGKIMRQVVLGSIAISQMGFSCAYYIFIGKNLKDLVMVVSDCKWIWPDWVFIIVQLALYAPLSLIRNIKHFSFTSLIADVFILLGLGYILICCLKILIERGPSEDLTMFNSERFSLFIGTSMFAFEGICLILPIGESMKKPERFPATLTWSVVVIGSIFVLVASIAYLTFGNQVEPMIFLNLPSTTTLTSLQFFYAIAIMLSFPLCVYPAIKITENALFAARDSQGKDHLLKNVYRIVLVSLLAMISWLESDKLEKFVSLVGCLACIPLSFIYPCMFHLKVAQSRWIRMKDWILIVFGSIALIYTTTITLSQWGVQGSSPSRCT